MFTTLIKRFTSKVFNLNLLYFHTLTPLVIYFLFSFFLFSCNSSTDPPPNGSPDTTSHNFTWVIDTFGIYPSYLKDVTIIKEKDIWAVGAIHTEDTDCYDSLGNWIDPYNAVHWDGEKWELKRTYPKGNGFNPNRSVFAFASNDVWVGTSAPYHWDGNKWKVYDISGIHNGYINKIWGTNSSNLYIVGTNGSISHYDGQNWQKIESGTEIDLTDIWGSPNGKIIWACGFKDDKGSVLLRNTGSGFEKVLEITSPNIPHPPNQITHIFKSLWTDKTDSVYLGAIGRVYIAPKNTNGYARESFWWDYDNETGYPPSTEAIRGTTGNDIFVAGYTMFIAHYNGKNWQRYPEIEGEGIWYALSTLSDMVIAVGERYNLRGSVIIARGYRGK